MARLGLRGRAAVGFAASCAVAIVVSLAAAGALLTGGLQAGGDGEYLTEALRELVEGRWCRLDLDELRLP